MCVPMLIVVPSPASCGSTRHEPSRPPGRAPHARDRHLNGDRRPDQSHFARLPHLRRVEVGGHNGHSPVRYLASGDGHSSLLAKSPGQQQVGVREQRLGLSARERAPFSHGGCEVVTA